MENNINELSIVECIDILSDNIKNYGEGDVEFSVKTEEFKISSNIYNECTVLKDNIDADTFKSLLHLVKLHNNMKIVLKCEKLSDGYDMPYNIITISSDYKIVVNNEYYFEYIRDNFSGFIDDFELMTSDFYFENYN
nr:MAG TPA: hypothetical protein [Caudoviricetes sp.]